MNERQFDKMYACWTATICLIVGLDPNTKSVSLIFDKIEKVAHKCRTASGA